MQAVHDVIVEPEGGGGTGGDTSDGKPVGELLEGRGTCWNPVWGTNGELAVLWSGRLPVQMILQADLKADGPGATESGCVVSEKEISVLIDRFAPRMIVVELNTPLR